MNLYYVGICELLEGRRELEGDGYYGITEDNRIVFTPTIEENIEVISVEDFENELFEGCKEAIHRFSVSESNKDVYAFGLYADEHNTFLIYINTLDSLRKTEDYYIKKWDYTEEKLKTLRYALGDFAHSLHEFNEKFDSLYSHFETIAVAHRDEEIENIEDGDDIVIAFEKKIFNDAHYMFAKNVAIKLKDYLSELNTTDDFIYFASTGNDYIDYSITMRKTIDQELFYRCFPETKELDNEFENKLNELKQLDVSKQVDYWLEQLIKNTHNTDKYIITRCLKDSYHAFEALEANGYALVAELMLRIENESNKDILNEEAYLNLSVYVTALRFIKQLKDNDIESLRAIIDKLESYNIDDKRLKDSHEYMLADFNKYMGSLV